MTPEQAELIRVSADLKATKRVLGTLIGWMVQSAVSPIRGEDAETLLMLLDEKAAPSGPRQTE